MNDSSLTLSWGFCWCQRPRCVQVDCYIDGGRRTRWCLPFAGANAANPSDSIAELVAKWGLVAVDCHKSRHDSKTRMLRRSPPVKSFENCRAFSNASGIVTTCSLSLSISSTLVIYFPGIFFYIHPSIHPSIHPPSPPPPPLLLLHFFFLRFLFLVALPGQPNPSWRPNTPFCTGWTIVIFSVTNEPHNPEMKPINGYDSIETPLWWGCITWASTAAAATTATTTAVEQLDFFFAVFLNRFYGFLASQLRANSFPFFKRVFQKFLELGGDFCPVFGNVNGNFFSLVFEILKTGFK